MFGREARGRSPAYESLAASVAGDDQVLGFLAALPSAKRQPNLLFAAARYLLGAPPDIAALRTLVRRGGAELAQLMLARRTQTNEPARCATLLPALARLPGPLALIEVGASAGLTLLFDRYSYDYGGHHLIAGSDVDAPTLRCAVGGPVPLPAGVPPIAWRAGLDLIRWMSPATTTFAGCPAWSGRERATARTGSPPRSPPPAATRRRYTAATCSPTCLRWPPRLPPRPPWSSFTPRCWPMSRRRTGSGLPRPFAA